ncbi:MAG TPA: sigma-54 dependent transcriptional regulator [Bryobacteraceae bacterium]|nr:sigma-54 dependent transcriptional regulator [Bryobacteraceae bacterium]
MKASILVVDDEEHLRRVVQVQLQQHGYSADTAINGEEALAALRRSPYDLVLADMKMPGMSGLELLRQIKKDFAHIPVIILTAYGTIDTAVEAMRAGAFNYVTKPVHSEELKLMVARALEHSRLVEEVFSLRASLDIKYGFEQIIGRSEALMSVLDMASRASRTNSTVLIRGETGTGKELLARAIHFNSPRKQKPFVTINCGAIPRDLLESELFGYRRGAFTGAQDHKKGKFELADEGTLFLDEIGELPMELQVKLLRLLQNGEIEKIGATQPLTVDVRIVAATHRRLEAMIEDGTFREDLYYRLAVIPLILPPLRERADDIPELARFFFEKSRKKHGPADLALPPALLPYFARHRWPGNIRELENVMERLVVLSRGNEIRLTDLPEELRRDRPTISALRLELPSEGISLETVEKELIVQALQKFNGNQTLAAQYLDISRKTMVYRMEKHGLRSPEASGSVSATAAATGEDDPN